MRIFKFYAVNLLAVFILFSFSSYGQDRETLVDSLMKNFNNDTPGAVIGVYKDGEMIFSEAYGLANLAHQVPNTVNTKFNLGSASKQFVAFAVTLLASRDSLSIDDPVRKYIPELPEFKEEVTLRHLLSHTSGYRETYIPSVFVGKAPDEDLLTREGAIKVVQNQPELEFSPGSEFMYNSSGFVLLSEIVERVTKKPYQEWMKKNVFDPIDMNNSLNEMEVEQVIKGAADSYHKSDQGNYITDFSNRAYYGAADLYTNLEDIGKWFNNFKTGKVGGDWVKKAMIENYKFTSGENSDYSLGLFVDDYKGLKRIWHSGSHAGYRAALIYYPEIDGGVAVLSNYNEVPSVRIGFDVSEIFFAEHMDNLEVAAVSTTRESSKTIEVDEDLLKRYVGTYYTEERNSRLYSMEVENGVLYGVFSGERLPFEALSGTLFSLKNSPSNIKFTVEEDGSVNGGVVPYRGNVVFKRVRPESSINELKKYAGDYYSPELNYSHVVDVNTDTLIYHLPNEKTELISTQNDTFLGKDIPVKVRYERKNGEIAGYYISLGRTRNIWFEKKLQ